MARARSLAAAASNMRYVMVNNKCMVRSSAARNFSTEAVRSAAPVLTREGMQKNLVKAQYAVRGELFLKARELQAMLDAGDHSLVPSSDSVSLHCSNCSAISCVFVCVCMCVCVSVCLCECVSEHNIYCVGD